MNTQKLIAWGLGVLALGATVYAISYAWQKGKNKATPTGSLNATGNITSCPVPIPPIKTGNALRDTINRDKYAQEYNNAIAACSAREATSGRGTPEKNCGSAPSMYNPGGSVNKLYKGQLAIYNTCIATKGRG